MEGGRDDGGEGGQACRCGGGVAKQRMLCAVVTVSKVVLMQLQTFKLQLLHECVCVCVFSMPSSLSSGLLLLTRSSQGCAPPTAGHISS